MLSIRPLRRDQRGQTFVELLTALFVLSVALVGALSLATSNAQSQQIGANRLIASNLAREAVETARALRDTNWLLGMASGEWDTGLADAAGTNHCAILTPARFVSPDGVIASPFRFVECKKGVGGEDIAIDPLYRVTRGEDGAFLQPGETVGGTPSNLYRKIRFDPICLLAEEETIARDGDCGTGGSVQIGIAVTAEVGWEQGGKKLNVKMAEELTNWR